MYNDSYTQIYTPAGLFTPLIFSILLNHEVARMQRYPSPISLALFSICKPAPLSDELCESAQTYISQILKTKLRQTDISSQYGEDFLILLTNTDLAGAKIAAQRLLDQLNTRIFTPQNKSLDLGVCAGLVAMSAGPRASADSLLEKVTQAHQRAREKGSNALVTFDTE